MKLCYISTLAKNGFSLTYKVADDASLQLKKYGEFLYDHIIVFAPTVEEFGGALRLVNIIRYKPTYCFERFHS